MSINWTGPDPVERLCSFLVTWCWWLKGAKYKQILLQLSLAVLISDGFLSHRGTPKSSLGIFHFINQPFWIPPFMETPQISFHLNIQ